MKFYISTSYDEYKENKESHIEKYVDFFKRKKFNILKEKEGDKYFIEINTLEELVELLKLARKELILKEINHKDPYLYYHSEYGIEIYDYFNKNEIYGITGLPKEE